MNGSNGAAGNRGRQAAAGGPGRCAAQGHRSTTIKWPWEERRPCFVCQGARHAVASCERWDRVEAHVRPREPGRVMWGRPERLQVCKDCCIGVLGGHRCVWWHMCWEEWPGR